MRKWRTLRPGAVNQRQKSAGSFSGNPLLCRLSCLRPNQYVSCLACMFLLFRREPSPCHCLKVDDSVQGGEWSGWLMEFSILCHYFKKLSSCFPFPFLLFQSEKNLPFIFLFACFIVMTVKKPVCQCTAELLLAHEFY